MGVFRSPCPLPSLRGRLTYICIFLLRRIHTRPHFAYAQLQYRWTNGWVHLPETSKMSKTCGRRMPMRLRGHRRPSQQARAPKRRLHGPLAVPAVLNVSGKPSVPFTICVLLFRIVDYVCVCSTPMRMASLVYTAMHVRSSVALALKFPRSDIGCSFHVFSTTRTWMHMKISFEIKPYRSRYM